MKNNCMIFPNKKAKKPASREEIEYEKCIICGKETYIPIDMHVANRTYYIPFAGQLCKICYNNLYSNY